MRNVSQAAMFIVLWVAGVNLPWVKFPGMFPRALTVNPQFPPHCPFCQLFPLSYREGKGTPPIIQEHLWILLHPLHLTSTGADTERRKGKQPSCGPFPPDSTLPTFSKSSLPSFASPVNAIKHTSMPNPLGAWNVAYKLPAFLGRPLTSLFKPALHSPSTRRELRVKSGVWRGEEPEFTILHPGGLTPHSLGCASAKLSVNIQLPNL